MTCQRLYAILLFVALALSGAAQAQTSPFGDGWQLDPAASTLQFQSIKNGSTIETSGFATFGGEITPTGEVTLTVLLDSVDTKIDLRNVRMRFLFFETFTFPEAKVTAVIDPAMVTDLPTLRRKVIETPFTLDLHGATRTLQAKLSLTLIGDDLVAVSSAEPIVLPVADFNLTEGLAKLQEAANVEIVPSGSVSFDLIFRKRLDGSPQPVQVAAAATGPAPSAALETAGDFSLEACIGRFEILSRSGNIYFKPGSAGLDAASTPLLTQVADIITRCPDLRILIGGHTDDIGSAAANLRLSERRAAAVAGFLQSRGIDPARISPVGFGESRPIADNATDSGRGRNRRIEFSVDGS